mgnify:CR=1 FL=1
MTFITFMIFGPRRSSPLPALPKPARRRPLFLLDQERDWTRQDYDYKVTSAGLLDSAVPHPLEEMDNHPAIIFNERAAISDEAVRHGWTVVEDASPKRANMANLRVYLVDDHPLMRMALRRILESDQRFVIGESDTAVECLTAVAALATDMGVMESQLPLIDGVEATRRLKSQDANLKVVMVRDSYTVDASVDGRAIGSFGVSMGGNSGSIVDFVIE